MNRKYEGRLYLFQLSIDSSPFFVSLVKMRFFKKNEETNIKDTPTTGTPFDTPPRAESLPRNGIDQPTKTPAIAVILGAVASIGGFIFGYESGQISGA